MFELSLSNLKEGTRFFLQPEEEVLKGRKQMYVEVCALSASQSKAIDDQTMKESVEFVQPKKENGKLNPRAALQRISSSDFINPKEGPALRNKLMWDAMITGWLLYDNDTGKEIPCTTENKIKLMNESPKFAIAVSDCLESLTESTKVIKDAEVKN